MAKQFSGVAGRLDDPETTLDRADHSAFEKALHEIEIDENKSRRLSMLCGRSWSVFRRQHATNPSIRRPKWLDHPSASALATLCLVVTWFSRKDADKEAVARIAPCKYPTFPPTHLSPSSSGADRRDGSEHAQLAAGRRVDWDHRDRDATRIPPAPAFSPPLRAAPYPSAEGRGVTRFKQRARLVAVASARAATRLAERRGGRRCGRGRRQARLAGRCR